jgi:hypothetical protein
VREGLRQDTTRDSVGESRSCPTQFTCPKLRLMPEFAFDFGSSSRSGPRPSPTRKHNPRRGGREVLGVTSVWRAATVVSRLGIFSERVQRRKGNLQ